MNGRLDLGFGAGGSVLVLTQHIINLVTIYNKAGEFGGGGGGGGGEGGVMVRRVCP